MIIQAILNFETAEQLKNDGMGRALDNAENRNPGWKDKALEMLIKFLTINSGPFQAEDFRDWAYAQGLPIPPHGRAFGGIMTGARHRGLIKFVGHSSVSNPLAHKAIASVWIKAQ